MLLQRLWCIEMLITYDAVIQLITQQKTVIVSQVKYILCENEINNL